MKLPTIALYCLLFLFACKETKNSPSVQAPHQTTEIGKFPFWHHVKKEGVKPKQGQIVQYHFRLSMRDSVLANTFGSQPVATFFPMNVNAQANPTALVEGFRQMAVGDSLTIRQPVGDETDNFYNYDIVVLKIMDSPVPLPPGAQ